MALLTRVAIAGVAVLSATVLSVEAAQLAYEPFNYTSGSSLTGQNGGTGFSGAYTNTTVGSGVVAAAGLSYTDANGMVLPTSGLAATFNNTHNFRVLSDSPEAVGTTLYISFLANLGGPAGFAGFSLFQGTVEVDYLGRPNGSGFYGIDPKGGGTVANSAVSASTNAFLVFRIDFTSSTLTTTRLYVNPTLGVEPAAASATASRASAMTYDNVRFQTSTPGTFDELRIGTTYADVAPVPEPTSALLGVLGGLGMLGLVRRRRA